MGRRTIKYKCLLAEKFLSINFKASWVCKFRVHLTLALHKIDKPKKSKAGKKFFCSKFHSELQLNLRLSIYEAAGENSWKNILNILFLSPSHKRRKCFRERTFNETQTFSSTMKGKTISRKLSKDLFTFLHQHSEMQTRDVNV